jgi:hypothetical protein
MTYFIGGSILVGGILASESASEAAAAGKEAGEGQIQLGREQLAQEQAQFDIIQGQTEPYREAGGRALSQLEQMMSGEYDITKSAGYDFRLQEGYKGVERSQAGRRLGGRAAKEMARYGQEYASAEYGKEFGRLSQIANYGVGGVAQNIAATPSGAGYGTTARGYSTIGQAGMTGAQGRSQALQGTAQNLMTWGMYNRGGGYDPSMGSSSYDPARTYSGLR